MSCPAATTHMEGRSRRTGHNPGPAQDRSPDMTRFLRPIALAALFATPVSAQAQDLPPLGQQARIWEGLLQTAMAYEIGNVCDSLEARMAQGWVYLLSLNASALDLGYSAEQVDAFIDDEAEQARLEAEARARLSALGAVDGHPETFCEVGRAEIAKGSRTGLLLRE